MRAVALALLASIAAPALAAAEAPNTAPADAGMTLPDFQTAARTRMMRADADHDGKLSASELSAAAAARGGGRRDPGRMFKWLDGNGDGFLDAAEIDARSARRFARLDSNGDGRLTAAERQAGRDRLQGGTGRGLGWRNGPRQPNPGQPNMDRQDD